MLLLALALCGVVGTSLLLTIALLTAWARFGRNRHAAQWTAAFFLFTLDHFLMVVRVLAGGEREGLTLIATYLSLAGSTCVALGFRARAGLLRSQWVTVLGVVAALICTGLILWEHGAPVHHPVVSGLAAFMLFLAVDALRRGGNDGYAAGTVTLSMMSLFAIFFVLLTVLGAITVPIGKMPDTTYRAVYLVGVPTSLTGVGLFALILLAEDLALKLHQIAIVDPLTAVLNRRGIEIAAQPVIARCLREARPLTVVVADLDHFKAVNDAFGHAVGDCVLQSFAAHLSASVRSSDLVGRLGGEEFILILPDAETDTACELITRIRATASKHVEGISAGAMPTSSFGIALLRRGETLATSIERADMALYQAKADGRNCIRIAVPW